MADIAQITNTAVMAYKGSYTSSGNMAEARLLLYDCLNWRLSGDMKANLERLKYFIKVKTQCRMLEEAEQGLEKFLKMFINFGMLMVAFNRTSEHYQNTRHIGDYEDIVKTLKNTLESELIDNLKDTVPDTKYWKDLRKSLRKLTKTLDDLLCINFHFIIYRVPLK